MAAVLSNQLAHSNHGMMTSPHDLASEAGVEVLAADGTAIEAAIAIGAVLCVTYPHFSGLGCGAFLSFPLGQVISLFRHFRWSEF